MWPEGSGRCDGGVCRLSWDEANEMSRRSPNTSKPMEGREKKFLEAYFLRSIARESVFGVPAHKSGREVVRVAKRKLNKRLFNRIKKHILAMPERLRMDHWQIVAKPGRFIDMNNDPKLSEKDQAYTNYGEPDTVQVPKCGTIGCIAGWACFLSNKRPRAGRVQPTAEKLLGIGGLQSDSLFLVDEWPSKESSKYENAATQRQRAALVVKRIDNFIKEQTAGG